MDDTDPKNSFDERGRCRHCRNFDSNIVPNWDTGEKGWSEISRTAEQIKASAQGQEFDCILGLSGGLDSSYLAYIAKEKLGLRPLIFHVDAGWNTRVAVHNIEKIVEGLGLELYTEVIDWEEMRDLQLSFFKSGVAHLDTPQDHAFFATMYKFAKKHHIRYILNGGNYSTECVDNPLDWHYHASDAIQLLDIHRRFGQRPLKTFPICDILTYKVFYRYIHGLQVVRPLNFVSYVKADAEALLSSRYGWQPYPHKHYESRFTRFYEGYWKPTRFGIDMRKVQFSSLILTGQMKRDDALALLAKPALDEDTVRDDFRYIASKLGIEEAELRQYHAMPTKSYRDYRNRQSIFNLGTEIMRAFGMTRSVNR